MIAYTQNCSRSIAEHHAGLFDILAETFCRWMNLQRLKFQLARERRQLREMSDNMLRDIGIGRAEAEIEAASNEIPAGR